MTQTSQLVMNLSDIEHLIGRTSRLSPAQRRTVQAARVALDREQGTDTASLARRIGVLEWHLAELLALVGQLAGDD